MYQIYATPTTDAATGKATKHTDLLDQDCSAVIYDSNDSFSTAAIKVGSILVGAGAITWYGVPLFVYLVRLVLPKQNDWLGVARDIVFDIEITIDIVQLGKFRKQSQAQLDV